MITVYHGSNIILPEPSLAFERTGTDFGSGFYVTEDYKMAEKWDCRKKHQLLTNTTLICQIFKAIHSDSMKNGLIS